MNLMSFLAVGSSYADKERRRRVDNACEAARKQWIDALYADQTRAWMSLGESQPEALNGLVTLLTMAGMCKVFDCKNADIPDVRVIRGALSTAQQCARREYVMDAPTVQALASATDRAIAIVKTCSRAAIEPVNE
jgi:hypothetical protein